MQTNIILGIAMIFCFCMLIYCTFFNNEKEIKYKEITPEEAKENYNKSKTIKEIEVKKKVAFAYNELIKYVNNEIVFFSNNGSNTFEITYRGLWDWYFWNVETSDKDTIFKAAQLLESYYLEKGFTVSVKENESFDNYVLTIKW